MPDSGLPAADGSGPGEAVPDGGAAAGGADGGRGEGEGAAADGDGSSGGGEEGDGGGEGAGAGNVAPGGLCSCDADCASPEQGYRPICVFGICMVRAAAGCLAAGSAGECPTHLRCWGLRGHEGSICWPDCDSFACAGACDEDGSCVMTEATSCDAACGSYCASDGGGSGLGCAEIYGCLVDCGSDEVCQQGCLARGSERGRALLDGMLGCWRRACAEVEDDAAWERCVQERCPAENESCLADQGTSGCDAVYQCLVDCADDEACADRCAEAGDELGRRHMEAMLRCFSGKCRNEEGEAWQECVHERCGDEIHVCFHGGCLEEADCGEQQFCDEVDHTCRGEEERCSPENPRGLCPAGWICREGACSAFVCSEDVFEPNDDQPAASPLQPGQNQRAEICNEEVDWFSLTVPAGHFGTFGIRFANRVGDLELGMYEGEGWLANRWGTRQDVPRSLETGEEYQGFLAALSPRTMLFEVRGYDGAQNSYALDVRVERWADGADCLAAGFGLEECRGCDILDCIGSEEHPPQLIRFPHPDPGDPYVGDGYIFQTYTNYLWVRREVAMQIRHAIHEVQQAYPGTRPLGLIDMSQRDGITPGYDVDDPRHPETTHDGGGNIDVAYYQRGRDNHARVVCGPGESNSDGAYCTEEAQREHIVDLPRTAYFAAMLVTNPRLRVIGMDRVIAPLVLAELERLVEAADPARRIDRELAGRTRDSIAYGDGWPYHHHHMHVSFLWWFQCNIDDECPQGYRCNRGQCQARAAGPGVLPAATCRAPAEGDAFDLRRHPLPTRSTDQDRPASGPPHRLDTAGDAGGSKREKQQ